MSSGDKKNLLRADNGFLRFGSNFEELMPGYTSPVHFSEINPTLINNAIRQRHDLNELDHETASHDPDASHEHDHILSFFERTFRRIAPQIEEARKKRALQEAAEAQESLQKSLSASDEVIAAELNELTAQNFRMQVELANLVISDLFTDDELGAISRQLERDKNEMASAQQAGEEVQVDSQNQRHQP